MVAVEIKPMHAYFAKQCPQRVQLDVLQPCEPLPDPPFLQRLFRAGDEYQADAISSLLPGVEDVVVVEAEDADAREWQTMRAVAAGAPIIAGGRLPVDHEAHRVGEPDLLVRHGEGYLPLEVKAHKVLDAVRKPGTGTALVSDMSTPFFDAAVTDPEHTARHREDDLLQLAHYRALLDSAGIGSPGCCAAGVYGSEGVIVWYDLTEPVLEQPEDPGTGALERLSPMVRYELEFARRLSILRAAEDHLVDAATPLLAEPVVCTQCDTCRWREWCGDRLEDAADLSLLAGIGAARRNLYKAHGVADLHDLAALDWRTAELLRVKVDLCGLREKAAGCPASTSLSEVIAGRPKQLEALAEHGLHTVGDLAAIDTATHDLCAGGVTNAATQIELARARVGTSPAYRARGVEIAVPRGDVEVDVDMESTNDGCYLWGALVSDRRVGAPAVGYVSFASWDPDLQAGEVAAFAQFWSWFADLRVQARAEGASFRAYCYSKGAEQTQMTRLADRLGLRDEVDEFLASDEWVDLLDVVRAQLVTGRSMGLKQTAPLAGFAWRTEDSGGTLAMVKYDEAVDEDADLSERAGAQKWILEYNEDDVRATAALRGWLDGPARDLPSIEVAPG